MEEQNNELGTKNILSDLEILKRKIGRFIYHSCMAL